MDPSGPVRDLQAGKDFRVGRLRLHGMANPVDDARMGIDPGRRHPGMGGKNVPDQAPGARVALGPKAGFNVGQEIIGEDGDEEVGPGPVGFLMKDGPDSKVGLQRPERSLHLRENRVERPDIGGRQAGMGRFDHIGAREVFSFLAQFVLDPGKVRDSKRGSACLFAF